MAARKQKPKPRGASRTRSAPAKKPVPGWIWLASGLVIGGFLVFLSQLKPGSDEVKRAVAGKPETAASQPAKPATPPRPKYEFYEELAKANPSPLPGSQPTPEQVQAVEAARAQALLEGRTPPPRLIVAPAATAATTATAPVAAALTAAPKPVQAAPQPQAQSPAPAAKPPAVTKTPAAQPAATSPAKPSSRFVLQAGSFASRDQAESARAKLILLGQDARIESGKVGDKTWHRLVVGPFASRQQADGAQKQLGANGVSSVVQQRR
ncbi:Cell division protein FtsN [compost metagenome]